MTPAYLERLPPQNLEAEAGVLGSIILDARALSEVIPILDAEDFYRDVNQVIYQAIYGMATGGAVVDQLTLIEELTRLDEVRAVGGIEFVTELVNGVPHSANALYYADIVKQKAEMRRNIDAANDVLRDAYSNQFTAEQITAASQARFLAIGERGPKTEVSLREAVDRALDTMDARWRGEDPGVRLPYPELDRLIDGFRPRRLYIVGGRPGSGKSAFLFNAADHAALNLFSPSVPVLFFSLEMDAEELGERYMSARASVNGYGFKRPDQLQQGPLNAIYKSRDDAAGSLLRIDDEGGLTVAQIGARARRHKQKYGLGIIFIDYLQLIDGSKAKGENRQEEVARVSRGLKLLAKELQVPVVAAAQLNRAVENRPAADQIPRMADLRESGQMDADAHGVLLFHAPTDSPGLVNVIVAKNRGGATGTVPMSFSREFTRFDRYDPVPDHVPQPEANGRHEGNGQADF